MLLTPFLGCIFLILYMLGYSLFCKKLLKIEFSHSLIFSVASLLSIYYIAALLRVLDPIAYSSFILGIALFIWVTLKFFQNRNLKRIFELFTHDILVLVIIIIGFFCIIEKVITTYAFWDEYSYWGVVIKEMNINHGLRFAENKTPSSILLGSYAQGATIFQYVVTRLIGFKESSTVFANGLIYIIFNSIVLIERKFLWSIALFIITILPSLFFNVSSINSLHLDGTIGCIFGSLIAIYLQSKKYDSNLVTTILIIPILFILPNIKEVGYWFAYAALIFITIDSLLSKNYKYLIIILLLMLIPFMSKFSWCFYLKQFDDDKCSLLQIPFAFIVNINAIWGLEKFDLVKKIFWQIIPFFYSKTMLVSYILIGITLTMVSIYQKQELKRFFILILTLFIIFCLYIIFRIELYLNIFNKFEAENVASYERYLGCYTIVFTFFVISYVKIILEQTIFRKARIFSSIVNIKFNYVEGEKKNNCLKFLTLDTILFKVSVTNPFKDIKFGIIYPIFLIIFLILSIKSYKKIKYELKKPEPYYFHSRQNILQELRKNGLDNILDFKGHDLNTLDCFIYRYLRAPIESKKALFKCLRDVGYIFHIPEDMEK